MPSERVVLLLRAAPVWSWSVVVVLVLCASVGRRVSTASAGSLSMAGLSISSNASSGNIDGLELGHLLGKGSFGSVYYGSWMGTPVAVKVGSAEHCICCWCMCFGAWAVAVPCRAVCQPCQHCTVYTRNHPCSRQCMLLLSAL